MNYERELIMRVLQKVKEFLSQKNPLDLAVELTLTAGLGKIGLVFVQRFVFSPLSFFEITGHIASHQLKIFPNDFEYFEPLSISLGELLQIFFNISLLAIIMAGTIIFFKTVFKKNSETVVIPAIEKNSNVISFKDFRTKVEKFHRKFCLNRLP